MNSPNEKKKGLVSPGNNKFTTWIKVLLCTNLSISLNEFKKIATYNGYNQSTE